MRHVDAKRVETATLYGLTDLGCSLDEPLAALDRWTASHWDQVEAAGQHWTRRRLMPFQRGSVEHHLLHLL
jgi:DNA-binding HxlR family transcriptional regulator